MTLQEFIKKYLGKQVEYHSYGSGALYQCVDLVNQYIKDVLGYDPIIGTNAKDFKDRYNKEQFTWVPNTPEAIPQKGDIAVWNGRVGGGAGHVAIVKDANINQFTSLDQNWSKVQRVTEEVHNYTNVSGWLHPKSNGSTTGETPIYVEISPDKKLPDEWYDRQEFKDAKATWVYSPTSKDAWVDTLAKANKTVAWHINNYEDSKTDWSNKKEEALKEQEESFKAERKTYTDRIKELEEELSNYTNDMAKPKIKPLPEALKEFARVALFAVLPSLIVWLENPDMGWKVGLVSIAIAFFKALDKYMHKLGKEDGNENLLKGLARF